ncbi:MAG: hypothetical protein HC881_21410 [Leptolyngbyaceae cyanobacterium SL_7_1]|nr:hypothetical protein [Leptolyngbyaceae cyanobacterium SL_7_1]
MTDDPSQIWFIVETETLQTVEEVRRGERSGEDIGGGFGRVTEHISTITQKRVPLDAAALRAQLNGLLKVLGEISEQANHLSGLQLDEVELAVEITGEGQVNILGNSGKLGNKGAIALKFKRAT